MGLLSSWRRALRPADITEQRRIKEQLDASLEQLAAANYRLKLYLERAPLASIVWGHDQLGIVRCRSATRTKRSGSSSIRS